MLIPKVSVITICYNLENCIEKTLLSVINQSYSNVEYIVIDGASNDKTQAVIRKYLPSIDVYISENDDGIYDAMNKGIKKSTGDWIIFMNGGDCFYSEKTLENIFVNHELYGMDLVAGNVVYDSGEMFKCKYDMSIYIKNTLHHQGTFYRREMLMHRKYNIKFKILADYDFNLYCYMAGKKCKILNNIISICSDGGISKNISLKKTREEVEIKSLYFYGIVGVVLKIITYAKFVVRKYVLKGE